MSKRINARFHPQAWQNDRAIPVDPAGPHTWDVTGAIAAMPRDSALAIRDNQYESDRLLYEGAAPDWAKAWTGPFWVEVEAAIRDYFEEDVP